MKEINLKELVSAVPVETEIKKMTKREKLLHLAELTRGYKGGGLALAHRLEDWTPETLARVSTAHYGTSVFLLAMQDKTFQEQGLKPTQHGPDGSYADALGFLELTKAEMHAFSCDCGGGITNHAMADRIEKIAGGGSSPLSFVRNAFGI